MCFHLSFTVLVHYRLLNVLDFEGGPPLNSNKIILFRSTLKTYKYTFHFKTQGYHLLWLNFQLYY